MATTTPAGEQLSVHTHLTKGDDTLWDVDDTTTTCNTVYRELLELAASASDTSVNLSTKMDTCEYIFVREVTSHTFKYGPSAGAGNKFTVGADKPVEIGFDEGGTPPTLYFSNPSGTDAIFIELIAVGGRT